MARPKPWIGQIDQIQQKLREYLPTQPLGRRDIEVLFGLSRSAATELMGLMECRREFGAALIVTAGNVLEYLRLCPEGQHVEQERIRRDKLAKNLQEAAKDQALREISFGATSADEWARWKELPIRFEPGRMTVEFDSAEDLLHTLWRFTRACQGPDWDTFQRLTESEQMVLEGEKKV